MASGEFTIPPCPEFLLDPECSYDVRVAREIDVAALDSEAANELTEKVVYDVCEHDALCIVEQEIFDQVYALVRGFKHLEVIARKRLIDSLSSNLSVLNASIGALLAAGEEDGDLTASLHRSALKAYVFFLHWITKQAEAEEKTVPAAAGAAAADGAGRGGRGKKRTAVQQLLLWDWEAQRGKVMKGLWGVADLDLWRLFRPRDPDDAFLQLWLQMAYMVLDNPDTAVLRNAVVREAAFRVVAAAALRYRQLEQVAAALYTFLTRHEHLPPLLADLALFSSQNANDNRLAVEMLREVAAVAPQDYETQVQHSGGVGVRSVAAFIAELAERMPKTVAAHVSLLVSHLGGGAYPIRSGIVTAMAHIVERAFPPPSQAADAQGAAARLRSKQALLETLVERARDKVSYTRCAVLKAWAHLADKSAIPLGHWLTITRLAIGRLEDKSANVRKYALQLLMGLLLNNPFGPALPTAQFEASLAEFKAKLNELDPPAPEEDEDAGWLAAEAVVKQEAAAAEGGAERGGAAVEGGKDVDQQQATGEQAAAAMETDEQPAPEDPEAAAEPSTGPRLGLDSNIEQLRALVASLECALAYTRAMAACMPALVTLLASSTTTDITETITLLIFCRRFQIEGAEATIRKMLPLIFSREQSVKDAVLDALDALYLREADPAAAAENLVGLAAGSSLGELASLEEALKLLMHANFLHSTTLKGLWSICAGAHGRAAAGGEGRAAALRQLRSALALLTMAATHQPDVAAAHLDLLLRIGFCQQCPDATVTRSACLMLQHLKPLLLPREEGSESSQLAAALAALSRTVVASRLPESGWYSAAEAAIGAVYALHPAPPHLAAALLRRLAQPLLLPSAPSPPADDDAPSWLYAGGPADASGETAGAAGGWGAVQAGAARAASAQQLSRFFFVVGHIALQHLVHVEKMAKQVRRRRADAEKASAEAHAERLACGDTQGEGGAEEEDIAAQLGIGSVAADLELDAMKDAAEADIVAARNALGRYAPLVSAFCHNSGLLGAHANLRASALLALTKLMAIDAAFCKANLRRLFTLLKHKVVEPVVRSNLVIAIGDLAFRFPNHLEPWTAHMYQPLSDTDLGVRKNALMVLTHLILNDMMKVKGHIARLALCLQDPHPRIAAMAKLFFHELNKRAYKGTSPIYNLLPDILSNLTAEAALPVEQFRAIMEFLLAFIDKGKHTDPLVDKLCHRFPLTRQPPQWRNIAFCLSQLNISEKGFKKMVELFKCYKDTLHDEQVLAYFQEIADKMKKDKKKAELKAAVEDFEAKVAATAAERREEEEAAARAAGQDQPAAIKAEGGVEETGNADAELGSAADDDPDPAAAGGEDGATVSAVAAALSGLELEQPLLHSPTSAKAAAEAGPTSAPAAAPAAEVLVQRRRSTRRSSVRMKAEPAEQQQAGAVPVAAPASARRASGRRASSRVKAEPAEDGPAGPVTDAAERAEPGRARSQGRLVKAEPEAAAAPGPALSQRSTRSLSRSSARSAADNSDTAGTLRARDRSHTSRGASKLQSDERDNHGPEDAVSEAESPEHDDGDIADSEGEPSAQSDASGASGDENVDGSNQLRRPLAGSASKGRPRRPQPNPANQPSRPKAMADWSEEESDEAPTPMTNAKNGPTENGLGTVASMKARFERMALQQ